MNPWQMHSPYGESGPPPVERTEVPAPPADGAPQSIAGDPFVEVFSSSGRAIGLDTEAINDSLQWFADAGGQHHDDFIDRDRSDTEAVHAELQQLWGADMPANLQRIKHYLENGLPEGMSAALHDARLRGGRALLNDSKALVHLLGAAKRAGDLPALTGSVDEQIAAIESFMRTNRRAYSGNEPLQAKYRALLARRGR